MFNLGRPGGVPLKLEFDVLLSHKAKYFVAVAVLALMLPAAGAQLSRMKLSDLKRMRADNMNFVDNNIVVSGNVYLPFGDMEVYADKAVINASTWDVEATGNIQFYRWVSMTGNIDTDKLARLERASNILVSVKGIMGDIWGDQLIQVEASGLTDNIRAQRMVGNMETGYFQFENFEAQYNTFICKAGVGERRPDGKIVVKKAEISACNYLLNDNAHYSISCGEATLIPQNTSFYGYGLDNLESDLGEYSVFVTNGFAKVYGVPVLWLPVFYKPKDESPGLLSTQWGKASDWGYYVLLSKRFNFTDYPYSKAKLMADYYEKRGFAGGVEADFGTENSKTEIFFYTIRDKDPYESEDYWKYRMEIPNQRYDLRITNVTHITPKLDFRGAFELLSDPWFNNDFFTSRYDSDPQPSTYASLEQQFDHFSASLYIRAKVNDFFTTVQRLPSFRLDFQRQEILDTNIYYQGDFSMDYLKMSWLKFDIPGYWGKEYEKLKNYESFRLDTTHFLYYPLRFDWLTVVPRAGFKFTAYSKSSKNKVDTDDLMTMFRAADLQNITNIALNNFDEKGGSRSRFIGELGIEASTKIYNTWENVRSSWLQLDGLRHVMRPYVNYTFIPKPTVNREHLYYFDEIDRIDEQNFVRFGVQNRLQTRSGNSVRTYFAMENYWDLYLNKSEGFNNIGNFCTMLTASPFKGFSINTMFSIDAGNNNGDLPQVVRNGRRIDNPGINLKWLNRWNINVSYTPADDWRFTLGYTYHRPYGSRSAYSMGSTLTQFDAGSYFNNYFSEYTEEIYFGMMFPITPDRRTKGSFGMSYDFHEGYVDAYEFGVTRNFHCWELAFSFILEYDRGDGWHKTNWSPNFMVSAYLTGLENPLAGPSNNILVDADREMRRGAGSRTFGWTGGN